MLIWQVVNSKSLQNGTLEQMLIIYVTDSGKNPKHRICINYTVIHQQDHSCICSMIPKLYLWKMMETKTRKKLDALDFVSRGGCPENWNIFQNSYVLFVPKSSLSQSDVVTWTRYQMNKSFKSTMSGISSGCCGSCSDLHVLYCRVRTVYVRLYVRKCVLECLS